MILPDVNILIYAFRKDMAQHALCRRWLDGVIVGDAHFGLSPLVLSAVVRIATNPRIFRTPSPLEEAFAFCTDLRKRPQATLVSPGERHWSIFERLCVETETRGPRVSDAWFAALAIEWSCDWITLDRDFARFPGLTSRAPSVAIVEPPQRRH